MIRWAHADFLVRWIPAFALLLTGAQASAQDATVGAGARTTLPPRPVVYTAPATYSGGSDHDMWIGHLGIGWFGTRDVRSGGTTIPTPVVGVRYWVTPLIGVDAGLGLAISSGSTTAANGVDTDKPSNTTFVLHGGVPLAIAGTNHFSFQITPELDLGFGGGTTKMAGAADTSRSGFLLQVGGRAGAEVYFGFIGIPALALDASVGLFLRSSSGKTTQGGASNKDSDFVLATSSINQPWDIFRSNIAARYYF